MGGFVRAETCETRMDARHSRRADTEPFRTPDGRMVPGECNRHNRGAIQMEIMQSRIARLGRGRLRQPGEEAAALITKMIGANTLNDDERGMCSRLSARI